MPTNLPSPEVIASHCITCTPNPVDAPQISRVAIVDVFDNGTHQVSCTAAQSRPVYKDVLCCLTGSLCTRKYPT